MSYSEIFNEVLDCIPVADGKEICWEKLEKTQLGSFFRDMSEIEQNPEHHAEGDVYCHTKCVCEELIKMPEYRENSKEDKIIFTVSLKRFFMGKFCCIQNEDDTFMYFLFEFNLVVLPSFVRSSRYSVAVAWMLAVY